MLLEKIVLLAIVFSSLPFAFSESSTVEVPFDFQKQSCFLQAESNYQCNWLEFIEPFTIEDLNEYKHILDEKVYEAELAKLESKKLPVIPMPDYTDNELKIMELENRLDRGNASKSDSVYYHLLKELNTCIAGQEGSRSASIQDKMEFEVSDFTKWQMNNIEYSNAVGQLVKNIEACKAQQVLEYQVLSERNRNLVQGENDIQFSLSQVFTEDVQAVPFDKLNENSYAIDMNGVCDNSQYDWNNKIMMGCEDTREYVGTLHKGTSGKITYFSGTIGEYQKYLNENNRYATQDDLRNAELKAEPILKEMLEENIWYNRE